MSAKLGNGRDIGEPYEAVISLMGPVSFDIFCSFHGHGIPVRCCPFPYPVVFQPWFDLDDKILGSQLSPSPGLTFFALKITSTVLAEEASSLPHIFTGGAPWQW